MKTKNPMDPKPRAPKKDTTLLDHAAAFRLLLRWASLAAGKVLEGSERDIDEPEKLLEETRLFLHHGFETSDFGQEITDEVKRARILKALRKGGALFVHETPKKGA